VGGPPCQGFSTVRQVDAANHGSRVKRDKRRYLFRMFLDYVEHFQPRVFVMENVLGLQSAAKGKFFTMVQHEARNLGYRVHPQVEEAWKLGVPQKRRRQLIIGVRTDVAGFLSELEPASRAFEPGDKVRKCPMLWDAIGDLPLLAAGEGEETCDYDSARRSEFLSRRGPCAKHYLNAVTRALVSLAGWAASLKPKDEVVLPSPAQGAPHWDEQSVLRSFSKRREMYRHARCSPATV
jgi:DNA (cytosine-5)-methyltransferase 1